MPLGTVTLIRSRSRYQGTGAGAGVRRGSVGEGPSHVNGYTCRPTRKRQMRLAMRSTRERDWRPVGKTPDITGTIVISRKVPHPSVLVIPVRFGTEEPRVAKHPRRRESNEPPGVMGQPVRDVPPTGVIEGPQAEPPAVAGGPSGAVSKLTRRRHLHQKSTPAARIARTKSRNSAKRTRANVPPGTETTSAIRHGNGNEAEWGPATRPLCRGEGQNAGEPRHVANVLPIDACAEVPRQSQTG